MANNQKGVYHEACKDCLAIHENDQYKGCVHDSGCPLTQRSGDPTNATEYIPIQNLKFKKRMPTMRRKEAHNSFLLIYASSKVHSCHLTQFSTCNSGLSSSFLAGCFFAMMSFHDLSDVNFVSSLFAIFPDMVLSAWVYGCVEKQTRVSRNI